MRGCVVLLAEAGIDNAEYSVAYGVKLSDMVWHTDTDIQSNIVDLVSKNHTRVVRSTYDVGLRLLLDASNAGRLLQTCLEEIIRGVRSALELIDVPAYHTDGRRGRR